MKLYRFSINVKNKTNSRQKLNATVTYIVVIDNEKYYLIHEDMYFNFSLNIIKDKKRYGKAYKKLSYFKFREKIIKLLKDNKTPYTYDNRKNKLYKIPKHIQNIINQELNSNVHTISALEGFLRGSNITGADYDIKRTAIFITNSNYENYRFTNLFKHKIKKIKINYKVDDVIDISFEEFLELTNTKESFLLINRDVEDIKQNKPASSEWLELVNNSKLKKKIEIKNNLYSNRKYNKSERTQLRPNILKYSNQLNYWDIQEKRLEAAHIVDVRHLSIDKDGKYTCELISHNNGLLLPHDVHIDFDNYIFVINENGDIIYDTNSSYITQIIKQLDENYNLLNIDFKSMIKNHSGMKKYLKERVNIYYDKNKI